jgi:hypothetical protein
MPGWAFYREFVGDRAFYSFAHLALLRHQALHAVFRMPQKQLDFYR